MPNAALILAAGQGSRIQDSTPDKTLANLAGRPVITYSIEAFLKSGSVATIAILYRDEPQRLALQTALADSTSLPRRQQDFLWVKGGLQRQDSVLNGLRALPEETHLVFIHDAARPLITPEAIQRLATKADETGAACPARRVTDTIKQARPATDLALDAFVLHTIDRSRLWAVETPQVFKRSLILAAYETAGATGLHVTDDTAVLEEAGHPVAFLETESPNPKLTTPSDLALMEYLLKSRNERQSDSVRKGFLPRDSA